MRVLGIDPGGRNTGLVVCDGPDVVDDTVAIHVRDDQQPLTDYASGIADWLFGTILDSPAAIDLVAIEGVVAPNPHMGLSNPAGIVDTAVVFGHLWADLSFHGAWPVVEVAPGRHGDQPAAVYPAALQGRAPRHGTGDRRHARSAYDVALAGRTQHRIGGAA